MKKLTTQECEIKAKELIDNNKTIVIVRDNDNTSWSNGWVDFLMDNYEYSNLNSAMRVNLEKRIHSTTF